MLFWLPNREQSTTSLSRFVMSWCKGRFTPSHTQTRRIVTENITKYDISIELRFREKLCTYVDSLNQSAVVRGLISRDANLAFVRRCV